MKKKSKPYSGPSPLSDMITSFLKDKAPSHLNDEVRVFGAWPKAVGADVQKQAKIKSFKNGILFVETKHPIWTTELQAKSHTICKKMNQLLKENLIKEIHFRQARLS